MIITEQPCWTIIAHYGIAEYLRDGKKEIRTWDREEDAIALVDTLLQEARPGQRYLVHRRVRVDATSTASQCVYDVEKPAPWKPKMSRRSRR